MIYPRLSYRSSLIALAFPLLAPLYASPASAAVVTVNCGAGGAVQPLLDAAAPGAEVELYLSGTCTENIRVRAGIGLTIAGATGATIVQANANQPLLRVNGRATLTGLALKGAFVTSELVNVSNLARALFTRVEVSAPQASQGILVFNQSSLELTNSSVTGGTDSAIRVSAGSTLQLTADTSSPSPAVTVTVSAVNANDLSCEAGTVQIASNGSAAAVNLQGGVHGIYAHDCDVIMRSNGGLARIINTKNMAIRQRGGNVSLVRMTITGNQGGAAEVNYGSMEISGSAIGGNGSGLFAKTGASIAINSFDGINTLSGTSLFSCYQNGRIFADRVEGTIQPAPAASNCLMIGGAVTH